MHSAKYICIINDVIMKAVQYSSKASKTILSLLYSTCTNDLIVNSKRTCGVEDFLLAFCIEFNRFFIADSLLMNRLQEHLIAKTKVYLVTKKSFCNAILIENKNAFLEFFNSNNSNTISNFNKMNSFERSNMAN
jgi:hypothetical protein